jgi:hypothetical protein
MNDTIQEKLNEWAERYVPQFCELSETYKNDFYTQSSLSELEDSPRLMVIAINPKGSPNSGSKSISPAEYLSGNPSWDNRFDENGVISRDWSNYLGKARCFLGVTSSKKDSVIDNDKNVIWINMTPFVSNNGFSDLPSELASVGIKSTIELINIINPQRIVIFETGALGKLKSVCEKNGIDDCTIVNTKIVDNLSLEVGYINDIPTVCVNHPSGHWAISNAFVPVFIFLHSIAIQKFTKLNDVRDYMRKEFKAWQEQMKFDV